VDRETIERLLVTIEGSSDLLRQELKKSGADVGSWSRSTEQQVGKADASFKKMAATLRTTLGVFGIGFGVAEIANFTASAIKSADAIGETARAAGFGAERFQRLSFVFRQNGVEAQEFEAAMRSANTRLGQFITTGAGPAAKAIEQLGLKQRILSGEIRTNEQFFDAAAEAISKVDNAAQQGALSAAIFTREVGGKMAPVFAQGAKAMNDAAAAATGIFNDSTVRQADELADAWERIGSAAGNWAKALAISQAHNIGRGLGIDELQETDRGELERLQDVIRANEGSTFNTEANRQGLARVRERIAELERKLRYEELINTPFITTRRVAPDDGLSEISVLGGARALPETADVFKQWQRMWSDEGLKEASATIAKMPEDLKKLPPEFNSAVAALDQYNKGLKEAEKEQKQLASAIEHGLQSAIASALRTGRLEFKDFLRDLAIDLASSAIAKGLMSIFSPASGGVAGFFGGLFGGGRASGGPVQKGKAYLVNEGKPELFWPGMSGSMIPVGAGGGNVTIYNSVTVNGRSEDAKETAAMANRAMADSSRQTVAKVKDLIRRRQL